MRDYFDILLPYQLLYKFERLQFNTLAKKEQEKFEAEQAKSQETTPRSRSRKSSREMKTSFPMSVYVQIMVSFTLISKILNILNEQFGFHC